MEQRALPLGASPQNADREPSNTPRRAPEAKLSEEERAAEQYTAAIEPVVSEAMRSGHPRALVEALAYQVARLTEGYSAIACGHFLHLVGSHIYRNAQV